MCQETCCSGSRHWPMLILSSKRSDDLAHRSFLIAITTSPSWYCSATYRINWPIELAYRINWPHRPTADPKKECWTQASTGRYRRNCAMSIKCHVGNDCFQPQVVSHRGKNEHENQLSLSQPTDDQRQRNYPCGKEGATQGVKICSAVLTILKKRRLHQVYLFQFWQTQSSFISNC